MCKEIIRRNIRLRFRMVGGRVVLMARWREYFVCSDATGTPLPVLGRLLKDQLCASIQ